MKTLIPLGKTLTIAASSTVKVVDAGLASDGAYFQAVSESLPIRYYRMDSATTTETDYGSAGSDATHHASSALSTDGPQKDITQFSRAFNGDEETDVPTVAELNGSTSATFSLWFYNNDTTSDQWIFSTKDSTANERINLWADTNNSVGSQTKTYSFQMGSGTLADRLNTPSNSTLQNSWQHLVGVINGTQKKFYIDGILVASKDTGTISTIATQTANLTIGDYIGLGCDGNIADFAIWDRELDENEIANLYLAATVPNLVVDPFGLADWYTTAILTTEYGTAPDGTTTSCLIENGTGSDYRSVQLLLPVQSKGRILTFSFWVKAGTVSSLTSQFHTSSATNKGRGRLDVNLSTGTITATSGLGYIDSGIEDAGGGWYRVWLSSDIVDIVETEQARFYIYSGLSNPQSLGDNLEIWNVQITEGIGPTKPVLDPRS